MGAALTLAGPACRWADVAAERGLDFVHDAAVEGRYFVPESLGSGGGLLDYDGDGDLDVYLLNGAWRRADRPPLTNRLFRQDGDGRFVDVTALAGVGDRGYGMGLAVGDADEDGDPDLFVTNHGPDALYRNGGDGRFAEVAAASGLGDPGWGSSAVFFDADRDGDADLFVARYLEDDPAAVCSDAAGRRDYCGPESFAGTADRLYLNRGAGRFEPADGFAAKPGKGLGVVSGDFDQDGRADVYVANDGEANHLWRGLGDGTFEEVALAAGAALDGIGRAQAGMGIAAGDVDGDGDEDLVVTHLRGDTNTFYRWEGGTGFSDRTLGSGLAAVGRPRTGFGTALIDCDSDGDLDLAIANGRVTRGPVHPRAAGGDGHWAPYAEPNLLLLNDGGGHFADGSAAAGDLTAQVDNGRGLAPGDVDSDGRVDLLVTNGGGPVRLYRNIGDGGSWLLVTLDGGAEDNAILVARAGGLEVERRFRTAVSYLSAADPRLHLGLGAADRVDSLELRRAGRRVAWLELPVRRWLVLGWPRTAR